MTSLKRQLKRAYFQTSIIEAQGDSSKPWKALKHLLCNCDKNETIACINGKTAPGDTADDINTFFANIGLNLATNTGPSTIQLQYNPNPDIPFLNLAATTEEEVKKHLMNISD